MSDVEARIRRLEDRVELTDLATRYFLASDFDDYEAIARYFTPDGSFAADGFPASVGNEAIAESIRGSRSYFGITIHTPHYVLVDFLDDDNATGLVGAHLEIAVGGKTVFAAVRYEDVYVRQDGEWRFRSRNMRTVHAQPWEDVATSLTAELPIRWPGGEPAPSSYPRGV
jgi:uncharacterized protein (TIGR02246 family)